MIEYEQIYYGLFFVPPWQGEQTGEVNLKNTKVLDKMYPITDSELIKAKIAFRDAEEQARAKPTPGNKALVARAQQLLDREWIRVMREDRTNLVCIGCTLVPQDLPKGVRPY